MTDVITSAKSLKGLLEALKEALAGLARNVRTKLPPGAKTPTTPPTSHTALPDISDIPHPKNGGDLDKWADEVAGRHPELTPDEVKAIYRYTTDPPGYKEMNAYLRNPSAYSPADAARIQREVDDAVSGGMDKLPDHSGTPTGGGRTCQITFWTNGCHATG